MRSAAIAAGLAGIMLVLVAAWPTERPPKPTQQACQRAGGKLIAWPPLGQAGESRFIRWRCVMPHPT